MGENSVAVANATNEDQLEGEIDKITYNITVPITTEDDRCTTPQADVLPAGGNFVKTVPDSEKNNKSNEVRFNVEYCFEQFFRYG